MADPEPWFRTFKFLTWELFAFFFFGASFRKAATARASQESSWAPPENRSVTTLAKSFFFFLTTEGKDVFVLKFLCGNPGAGRVRRCWFLARCPFVLLLSWGLASPSHGVRRQQVFSWDPAQLGTSVRSCRCGAATAQSCGDIAKLFLWCKWPFVTGAARAKYGVNVTVLIKQYVLTRHEMSNSSLRCKLQCDVSQTWKPQAVVRRVLRLSHTL